MDCKKIKSIIPRYVNHSASEGEINTIEEHLCVCHECRQYLSDFLDKDDTSSAQYSSSKKDSTKIDIFDILVVAIAVIIVFISVLFLIKTH